MTHYSWQQCDSDVHYACISELFRTIGDRYLLDLLTVSPVRLPSLLETAQEALQEQVSLHKEKTEAPRFTVKNLGRRLLEERVLLFEDRSVVAKTALQSLDCSVAKGRVEVLRLATTSQACAIDPSFVGYARQLLVKSHIHRTTGLIDTLNGGGSASLYIKAPEGDGDTEHGRGRHIAPDRPLEATMELDNAILLDYYRRYESDVLMLQSKESKDALESLALEAQRVLAWAYANLILIGLRERGVV